MGIKEHLPRDKHDFERVELLKLQTMDRLRPILPELLEWQQDMNWPIAFEIQNILVSFGNELIPYIQIILNTDDGEWKYGIITSLLPRIPVEATARLKSDLERISLWSAAGSRQHQLDHESSYPTKIPSDQTDGQQCYD